MIATGTELRRFWRGRLPKLAVVAMVLMPLLYGALYLWAFWNPPGHLDRMPVALVNEDTGATVDGEALDVGADVVAELTADGRLGWRQVDAATAEKGVDDGTYYFAVVVPEDFSQRIASASGDEPTGAELHVTYDDSNNFLATTLGRSAMAKVEAAVRSSVGEEAVDKVLVGLGKARDGLSNASDGAVKLSDASSRLGDGATTLQEGAASASEGATSLHQGALDLKSGTSTLAQGATSLASGARTLKGAASKVNAGAGDLATGLSTASSSSRTLADGAATTQKGAKKLAKAASSVHHGLAGKKGLAAGASQAAKGAKKLAKGAKSANKQGITLLKANIEALEAANTTGALDQLIAKDKAMLASARSTDGDSIGSLVAGAQDLADKKDGLPALHHGLTEASSATKKIAAQLKPGSSSTTVRDGVDKLAAGSSTLHDALTGAAASASTLHTGAGDVSAGASSLVSSADQVASGASTVDGSVGQFAAGSKDLAEGTKKLDRGAGELVTGASDLGDGADTLASQLDDGAQQIPDDDDAQRTQRAEVVSSPVTLQSSDKVGEQTFGEGMAPFFLSLALFVGAFVIWTLMRPLPPRALATPARGLRIAVSGYLPALVVGAAQAIVLFAVARYAIGLTMADQWAVLGMLALVMAAFVAFQQMLIAVTGPAVGKVVIMALLMLQLTTAGGLYPVETTGAVFRALHPYLPMTYTVQGLRELITGSIDSRLWVSMGYLVGLILVSVAITAWRAGRLRTWSLERLHPAIAL